MNIGLSDFDGKRIAILLDRDRHKKLLRGTASYARDEELGFVLTIQIDADRSDGKPELIIDENQWSGTITADMQHGCEYIIELREAEGKADGKANGKADGEAKP